MADIPLQLLVRPFLNIPFCLKRIEGFFISRGRTCIFLGSGLAPFLEDYFPRK